MYGPSLVGEHKHKRHKLIIMTNCVVKIDQIMELFCFFADRQMSSKLVMQMWLFSVQDSTAVSVMKLHTLRRIC